MKHANDAVDRSALLLAALQMELRVELAADPRGGLTARAMVADLKLRQAMLRAACKRLAAHPETRVAKLEHFFRDYEEFLAAVGVARRECRGEPSPRSHGCSVR